MFTGLIEGIGRVRQISRKGQDIKLTVEPPFDMGDCRVGDSICVDGACLTITDLLARAFTTDVSAETVSRSTIGKLKPGDEVNLERALRLIDRLGGHLVLGHVDGVGKILKRVPSQRSWLLRIGVDKSLTRYTIEKGSIAVNGISLTINRCHDTYFEVNIIPQTGRETTILRKKAGDQVNIETDLIGKYVEKFVTKARSPREERRSSGMNPEILRELGLGD